jgi:hypothetical protein
MYDQAGVPLEIELLEPSIGRAPYLSRRGPPRRARLRRRGPAGCNWDCSLWFQAQGIEDFGALRGPAFDDPGLPPQAVLAAQGAALVPVAMAEREMMRSASSGSSGKSGPPPSPMISSIPRVALDRAKVTAFRAPERRDIHRFINKSPSLGSASTHWSITDWSERNESHTGTHHGE